MASAAGRVTAQEATAGGNGPRRVVAGHFSVDLDALLGQGGMALVYRGRDLRTRREVALKTLRIEYRRDPETRARFRREARTMAFLRHPNVARLYDLYEDDEAPWAILEYVPGSSLKDTVRDHGPFDVEGTASILDQVAGALAHLHLQGLVHLDVKPQNILLTPDGTVKLIDFGLAQPAGEVQELIGGSAFGTVAYLAPEQACGEPVDATTDVYALGCVVYELLTGRPPFEPASKGESKNEVIRAHLERQPAAPSRLRPGLPAWVDDVILEALAKRPGDRYNDVETFAHVFRSRVNNSVDGDDTTVRLVTPLVIDTQRVVQDAPAERGRPLSRRVAAGVYGAGGRTARQSRRIGRFAWRLTAAFALANLMLALVLLYREGALPGFGAESAGLEAGGSARVVTDGLRVRAAPGVYSEQTGLVAFDDRLELTGNAVIIDGDPWWPVKYEGGEGYVWGDGIEPTSGGLSGRARELADDARSLPGEVVDRLRDQLP